MGRRAKGTILTAATAAALTLGACGDDAAYENQPRPPSPINVTAAISDERVSVSPTSFGAGPIVLIVTNQSDSSQRITLESSEPGAGDPLASSSPINPRDTATLKVDVDPGGYVVRVDDTGVDAADVTVGAQRESAQNELLQP